MALHDNALNKDLNSISYIGNNMFYDVNCFNDIYYISKYFWSFGNNV